MYGSDKGLPPKLLVRAVGGSEATGGSCVRDTRGRAADGDGDGRSRGSGGVGKFAGKSEWRGRETGKEIGHSRKKKS